MLLFPWLLSWMLINYNHQSILTSNSIHYKLVLEHNMHSIINFKNIRWQFRYIFQFDFDRDNETMNNDYKCFSNSTGAAVSIWWFLFEVPYIWHSSHITDKLTAVLVIVYNGQKRKLSRKYNSGSCAWKNSMKRPYCNRHKVSVIFLRTDGTFLLIHISSDLGLITELHTKIGDERASVNSQRKLLVSMRACLVPFHSASADHLALTRI